MLFAKRSSRSVFSILLVLLGCTALFWLPVGCELEPFSADKGYKCNGDNDCLSDFQCQASKCVRKPTNTETTTTTETTQDGGENPGTEHTETTNETNNHQESTTTEPGPEPGPEPSSEPGPEPSSEPGPESATEPSPAPTESSPEAGQDGG